MNTLFDLQMTLFGLQGLNLVLRSDHGKDNMQAPSRNSGCGYNSLAQSIWFVITRA